MNDLFYHTLQHLRSCRNRWDDELDAEEKEARAEMLKIFKELMEFSEVQEG